MPNADDLTASIRHECHCLAPGVRRTFERDLSRSLPGERSVAKGEDGV